MLGEKIPLIRRVTNFASNLLICRLILDDKSAGPGLKSRFSLYFAPAGRVDAVVTQRMGTGAGVLAVTSAEADACPR